MQILKLKYPVNNKRERTPASLYLNEEINPRYLILTDSNDVIFSIAFF